MAFYQVDEKADRIGSELLRRAQALNVPKGLDAEKFAMTLLLHHAPLMDSAAVQPLRGFGYRASTRFYPCSVVKVFYLIAAQARLEEGYVQPHGELARAMRDMILVSSNTATNYVIDLITGTTGDTLLPEEEMAEWVEKREWANRYFRSLGYAEFDRINVCQKLMDDQRYGRERLYAGADGSHHNALTTDAVACLFHGIFTGQLVTPARCRLVADTLSRPLDPAWISEEPRAQITGYFGAGLPPGSRLWSKAGWTGWTGDPTASYRRHDAAYIELPTGKALTLVAFTEGRAISADESCLPSIARLAANLILDG
jgi:beta-lactamase class A